jgi:hypothetical protein
MSYVQPGHFKTDYFPNVPGPKGSVVKQTMQMQVLKTYTYRCQEGDLLKAFLLLYPDDMMRETPGFTGRQSGFAASAPKPPPPPVRAYVPLGAGGADDGAFAAGSALVDLGKLTTRVLGTTGKLAPAALPV